MTFNVANFKLFKNEYIKNIVSTHILGNIDILVEMFINEDPPIAFTFLMGLVALIVLILSLVFTKTNVLEKIKKTIFFSSLLQPII